MLRNRQQPVLLRHDLAVTVPDMGADSSTRRLVSTYSLVTVLSAWFVTQMLAPSKATPSRTFADVEGALHLPVAGPQLSHRVTARVRHPDVGSIEGHAVREIADVEGTLHVSRRWPAALAPNLLQ